MISNEGIFLSRIENLLLDIQSNTGYPLFLTPDTQVYKDHSSTATMFINIPYKNKIIQFVTNKFDTKENIKTYILSNPTNPTPEEQISSEELNDIKNELYNLTNNKPIQFQIISKKETPIGKPIKILNKKKYKTQEVVTQDMFDF